MVWFQPTTCVLLPRSFSKEWYEIHLGLSCYEQFQIGWTQFGMMQEELSCSEIELRFGGTWNSDWTISGKSLHGQWTVFRGTLMRTSRSNSPKTPGDETDFYQKWTKTLEPHCEVYAHLTPDSFLVALTNGTANVTVWNSGTTNRSQTRTHASYSRHQAVILWYLTKAQ